MASGRRIPEELRPYLEGEQPNEAGEWGMHCPFHGDSKRSASINFEKGKWYCNACQIGGDISELVDDLKNRPKQVAWFVDAESVVAASRNNGGGRRSAPTPVPSEGSVAGWHSALMSNADALEEFKSKRGLEDDTLERFQIGWDEDTHTYTIPIRDSEGQLVNVRHYDLHPTEERRKIWGVFGHNEPRLYPAEILEEDELILCEGEWDALILIQNGFPAITRTGSARTWRNSWSGLFSGKKVWIVHDMDKDGQVANRKVAGMLEKHASGVYVVKLPYKEEPKHGKDVTDYFWTDGHEADEFKRLMKEAAGLSGKASPEDYTDISVIDSFGADAYGKNLRLRVTVVGKRTPTYLLPDQVDYTCTMDAGIKCTNCPMMELQGTDQRSIEPSNPILLEMMGSSNKAVGELLRELIGAPKCGRLTIEPSKLQSVEELYARPSVEIARVQIGQSGDYAHRKIISAGRHDTVANSTVEVVGAIYPNPRTQHNELLAWNVEATETSIDHFDVTPEILKQLMKFRTRPGQRPLHKLGAIADDLATHVTHIYGRREMHVALDLVFHSALSFWFDGSLVGRGWLEVLIVGDTRTGKSEVASSMVRHYRAGEMVTCESATFAGVVGGLQQLSSGKEWEVTWGAIPLNDRRLVVLDEVAGLSTDQIAQMSSIRSSGEAQLTKIRSERTWARTRLAWLGNPRNGRMADYTYGVQAIRPLIGNNEDIARFDMAMSVKADEVAPEDINKHHADEKKPPKYDSESCQLLVQWAWSRTADNIKWQPGAEAAVFSAALDLGKRYMEDPPLVQAANVRVKVARIAVAMAMRTFSSDDTGENVLVCVEHVEDAVKFLDVLYGMPGFGYKEHSEELIKDIAAAAEFYDETKQYLYERTGLAKFLRQCMGRFRSQDLQDMLMLDRDEASAVINRLWALRMITRRGPEIRIQPMLHELLREIKE